MANEVKIRIEAESDTRRELDKTEKDIDGIDKSLTRVQAEAKQAEAAIRGIKQAGPSLDSVKDDAKKLGAELDDVGDAGEDAADSLSGAFSSLDFGGIKGQLTGVISGLGGPVGLAGSALGSVFAATFVQGAAFELGAGRRSLATQLRTGLSERDVALAGEIAGGLYREGFGEGAAEISRDVADIIDALNDLPTSLSQSEIARRGVGLQDAIGVDLRAEIDLTRALVRNGLAPDIESAFDLIGQGFQDADGKGDEFLDILLEYGPVLKEMGIDGPAAVALITESLKDGDFQANLLIDSIKEFKIKLTDGTAEEALDRIGLSAKDMLDLFNEGRGLEAMELVIEALNDIDDAALRNKESAEIMGVALEDGVSADRQQQILNTASAINQVTFSTEDATAALAANKSELDQVLRSIESAGGAWFALAFSIIDATGAIDGAKQILESATGAVESLNATLDNFSVQGLLDEIKRIPGSISFPSFNVPVVGSLTNTVRNTVRAATGGGPPPGTRGGGSPRAVGGPAGGLTLLHEQGPELVRLPSGSQVMPASNTASLLERRPAAGTEINVTVQGSILTERDLQDVMRDVVDRADGFAGLERAR